ncbi:MAG: hypothetical protein ACREEE_16125, partial [Dongiaceae bacterium]
MFRYSAVSGKSRNQSCDRYVKASLRLPAVSVAVGLALATIVQGAAAKAAPPQPFKLANIHFETNASACDMGIQMVFDTGGITEGSVEDPNDQVVYRFQSSAGMADIGGQTEGFLEGVEPQITELLAALGCEPSLEEPVMSIQELFTAWPAGKYDFEGQGGGIIFEDEAILSHHIPAGPNITAPVEGTVVPHDQPLLIKWTKVTGPILPSLGPVQIVGYHVVVVDTGIPALPGALRAAFDVDVSKNETSVTVPKQYLEP